MEARTKTDGLLITVTLASLAIVAGCAGDQSSLDPAAREARAIADHTWFVMGASAVIYVIVMAILLFAMLRRARPAEPYGRDRRIATLVASGAGLTVLIVLVFLADAMATGRELRGVGRDVPIAPDALVIEVIGKQWWWDVQYRRGERPFLRTANEIHIPTGRPVVFELKSLDVIHSFWVPNLHGKTDLVPGETNSAVIRADRPGVYRGQCAEFCGLQHANMGMLVIARPPAEFDRWVAEQQRPGRTPVTPAEQRGRDVFVSSQCAMCHTVRGTTALATNGPDLTHLKSRRTLAAATIPNRRGHLGGWVADSQSVKPGNRMPPNQLAAEDFQSLLAYLESLR